MVFTFQPPFWAGLSGYVAELTASMICADLGLPTSLHDSHASYVAHWIGIMRADTSAIFTAARHAEQAFGYLRGFSAAAATSPTKAPALAA